MNAISDDTITIVTVDFILNGLATKCSQFDVLPLGRTGQRYHNKQCQHTSRSIPIEVIF